MAVLQWGRQLFFLLLLFILNILVFGISRFVSIWTLEDHGQRIGPEGGLIFLGFLYRFLFIVIFLRGFTLTGLVQNSELEGVDSII